MQAFCRQFSYAARRSPAVRRSEASRLTAPSIPGRVQKEPFSEQGPAALPASDTPTNVTSLSVKRSASLQPLVVARHRRYASLWSPALS